MRTRLIGFVALVALLTGCGPSLDPPTAAFPNSDSNPPTYVVINMDGPPLDLFVDGAKVARLVCGSDGIDLTTIQNIPPLPWEIDLVLANGVDFYSGHVESVPVSQKILIRRDSAGEVPWYASAGPPPQEPCPE